MSDPITSFKTRFCFEVSLTGDFARQACEMFERMVVEQTRMVGHYPFGAVIANVATQDKITIVSDDDSPDHEFIAKFLLELGAVDFVTGTFSFTYSHFSTEQKPDGGFGGGIYLIDFGTLVAYRYDTQEMSERYKRGATIGQFHCGELVTRKLDNSLQ